MSASTTTLSEGKVSNNSMTKIGVQHVTNIVSNTLFRNMDENARPSQKCIKRRKALCSHFKRHKNYGRTARAAPRDEERVLQPILSDAQQPVATLQTLRTVEVPGWTLSRTEQAQQDNVQFCILSSHPPTVVRSVTVCSDLTWYAHIFGKLVPRVSRVYQLKLLMSLLYTFC